MLGREGWLNVPLVINPNATFNVAAMKPTFTIKMNYVSTLCMSGTLMYNYVDSFSLGLTIDKEYWSIGISLHEANVRYEWTNFRLIYEWDVHVLRYFTVLVHFHWSVLLRSQAVRFVLGSRCLKQEHRMNKFRHYTWVGRSLGSVDRFHWVVLLRSQTGRFIIASISISKQDVVNFFTNNDLPSHIINSNK